MLKAALNTKQSINQSFSIYIFEVDPLCHLVDLPGYGFAKVSKQLRNHWNLVLSSFLLERQALKGLVIVVDIRRGIADLDRALIDMMDNSVPLHILLTKSDKLGRNAIHKVVAKTRAQLTGSEQTVSTLSIQTGQGLDLLEQKCGEWLTLA